VRNYSGKNAFSFFQKVPQNSGKTNAACSRCVPNFCAEIRHLTPEKDQIFLFLWRVKSKSAEDMRNLAGHVKEIGMSVAMQDAANFTVWNSEREFGKSSDSRL